MILVRKDRQTERKKYKQTESPSKWAPNLCENSGFPTKIGDILLQGISWSTDLQSLM
jgi:hypothetical protein